MKISLAIYAAPHTDGNAERAYHFARSALQLNHQIYRLFFFNEGVLNCADDTTYLCKQWQSLIEKHRLDAIICSASAEKRGLTSAQNYSQDSATKPIHAAFQPGGIAQLIDAAAHSERLLTFADT